MTTKKSLFYASIDKLNLIEKRADTIYALNQYIYTSHKAGYLTKKNVKNKENDNFSIRQDMRYLKEHEDCIECSEGRKF